MEVGSVLHKAFYQGPLKAFAIVINKNYELRKMGHFRGDLAERVYAVSVRTIFAILSAALLPLIVLGFACKGYQREVKRL